MAINESIFIFKTSAKTRLLNTISLTIVLFIWYLVLYNKFGYLDEPKLFIYLPVPFIFLLVLSFYRLIKGETYTIDGKNKMILYNHRRMVSFDDIVSIEIESTDALFKDEVFNIRLTTNFGKEIIQCKVQEAMALVYAKKISAITGKDVKS